MHRRNGTRRHRTALDGRKGPGQRAWPTSRRRQRHPVIRLDTVGVWSSSLHVPTTGPDQVSPVSEPPFGRLFPFRCTPGAPDESASVGTGRMHPALDGTRRAGGREKGLDRDARREAGEQAEFARIGGDDGGGADQGGGGGDHHRVDDGRARRAEAAEHRPGAPKVAMPTGGSSRATSLSSRRRPVWRDDCTSSITSVRARPTPTSTSPKGRCGARRAPSVPTDAIRHVRVVATDGIIPIPSFVWR